MDCVVMNFSGIYEKQDFKDGKGVSYVDVSDITGTDCYCDEEAISMLKKRIEKYSYHGIHYIDSGNYHYMSRLWLDKADIPFMLVVFDNHPDTQQPVFGDILSCGGWIKDVLESNRFLEKVIVIGVNGGLLEELDEDIKNEIENKRISFITGQEIAKRAKCITGGYCDEYADVCKDYLKKHIGSNKCVYISVDKDVLDESVVKTNWDQGDMSMNEMFSYIKYIIEENELIGIDVCGEPSFMDGGNEEYVIRSNKVNSDILNMIKNF